MPSDDRVRLALEALAAPLERFRSALAVTLEQARGILVAQQATANGRARQLAAELGPFAAGRMDVERLAALVASPEALEPAAAKRIERAVDTLRALLSLGDELVTVRVEPGARLCDAAAAALAQVGRAFGAARAIELAKSARYVPAEHDGWLAALPFDDWMRGERRLAPPLVVEVDGHDLRAGGLAEFLDGNQKIVLVVGGESPPAPLVRLITPAVFVLQSGDASGLERLAAWDGPGVAALVPEGAARFVHDPSAGSEPWQRLRVEYAPETAPSRALGGQSAFQQREELRQLVALVTPAAASAAVVAAAAPAAPAGSPAGEAAATDPVGKLAAWLLSQADLADAG
ncbi:MAG: hypothetical protein HY704_10615 [Gemmatimonadetes bacterium]|nr:hypothetical protein [Gemmatimonadota bacterium]